MCFFKLTVWWFGFLKKPRLGIRLTLDIRVCIIMDTQNIIDAPSINHLPSNFFAGILGHHETTSCIGEGPVYTVPYYYVAVVPTWNASNVSWGARCSNCAVLVLLGDIFTFTNTDGSGYEGTNINICRSCFEYNFVIQTVCLGNFPRVIFTHRIRGGKTKRAIKD